MPIYEYKCMECDNAFDELMDMDDDNPACPKCGGDSKKQVSVTSFHLKGTGWFKSTARKRKSVKHDPHDCVDRDGCPVDP